MLEASPNSNTSIISNTSPLDEKIEDRRQNDRELNSERLSQREMMIQTSINPFLSGHNYLDDLLVQDEFLRPKDSNIKGDE